MLGAQDSSPEVPAQRFRRFQPQKWDSESTPNSEGFLVHMLGATLVRVCTGSEAEAMDADPGSITA